MCSVGCVHVAAGGPGGDPPHHKLGHPWPWGVCGLQEIGMRVDRVVVVGGTGRVQLAAQSGVCNQEGVVRRVQSEKCGWVGSGVTGCGLPQVEILLFPSVGRKNLSDVCVGGALEVSYNGRNLSSVSLHSSSGQVRRTTENRQTS